MGMWQPAWLFAWVKTAFDAICDSESILRAFYLIVISKPECKSYAQLDSNFLAFVAKATDNLPVFELN